MTRKLMRGCMLALGAGLGLVLGCPLELQRGISCGDGWWDPEFEECDPRDVDAPYIDDCRARGIDVDAVCDPQTCTIRASEEDCQCRLDPTACTQPCGDGQILGNEECDPEFEQGGFKSPMCSDYVSTAFGLPDKHYTSGEVGKCNVDNCTFGRDNCTFCGDGVVDGRYEDWGALEGKAEIAAEVCDGANADEEKLDEYCEMQCLDDDDPWINGDVVLRCDFECGPYCSELFAPPNDVAVPGLGCCIAKGSPCWKPDTMGVPDLKCCSWLEKPLAEQTCVPEWTGGPADFCP